MIAIASTNTVAPQRLRALTSTRNAEDLAHVARLVAEGTITPLIERTSPLAETAAVIRDLENEHARGKVVLTM